jgi:succinate dehydrogenase / fumarate reductase, cytochrome b subunit
MGCCCGFYKTTIGKKIVVAVTGLIFFGFVAVHMLGNLKTFLGVDSAGVPKLDVYARMLREIGEHFVGHSTVLWLTRVVLLVALIIHVFTVYQLRRANQASRPVGYANQKYSSTTVAATTMWWGGLLLLAFIIFHILHFTTGQLHFQGFVEGRVYANVYYAFKVWYIGLIYVVAMCALCLHLYHGAWSLFQTLGLDNPQRNDTIRLFAKVAAFVIAVGFVSVPVAVCTGLLPPPPQYAQVAVEVH